MTTPPATTGRNALADADDHGPAYQVARVRILGNEPASPRRSRPTPPPGSLAAPIPPVAKTGTYRQADWDAESFAVFAEGSDPNPCPECGRTAFYGPRFVEPDRKCRACRFCGFWQEVDEAPQRYLPTAHGCAQWPEVSKAKYIWWVDPETESYTCPFCGGSVPVTLSLVAVPAEDRNHPWWRIPQNRSQSFYQRLWKNWEYSAGRTLL